MEAVPGLCVSFDWNHRYSAVLTDGSSLEIHVLISGYGNQFQKGKELVVIEIRCRIEAACWKQTNVASPMCITWSSARSRAHVRAARSRRRRTGSEAVRLRSRCSTVGI